MKSTLAVLAVSLVASMRAQSACAPLAAKIPSCAVRVTQIT